MSLAERKTAMPFVVDMPAPLLKRNVKLSKEGRILYSTMRSLADGKTGALKVRNRWRKATEIDDQAEMCRDVRLRAMRELLVLGLVTVERERVERVIGGRKRVVLGACHYFVHRQADTSKKRKKPSFLLKSISSTVEEIDSQDLSNPPSSACPGGVSSESGSSKRGSARNHHHPGTADDDLASVSPELPTSEQPNRYEVLQERAKKILTGEGEDPDVVDEAFSLIDSRSAESGKIPSDKNYYITSFKNLKATDEFNAVFDAVQRRRVLRDKFMPNFTGELTPDQEAERQRFNATVPGQKAG